MSAAQNHGSFGKYVSGCRLPVPARGIVPSLQEGPRSHAPRLADRAVMGPLAAAFASASYIAYDVAAYRAWGRPAWAVREPLLACRTHLV